MKEFFSIEENFRPELADLSALLTVLNVFLVIMRYWWAPFFGLANCMLGLYTNVKNRLHINMYVLQVALIVLNIFFLTM